MKSTIPAPGPDCTAEARHASVTGALCARMRREQETLDAAIRTLMGERAPSERDPEPYRPARCEHCERELGTCGCALLDCERVRGYWSEADDDRLIAGLTGERAPSERDPEPSSRRLMPLACNCGETGHVQCDMHGPRE
jgi:hypothetical protein